MRNFSQIITEPYKTEDANTNEFVGTILALSCLAFACGPLLKGIGERIAKGGEKKEGNGTTFWDFLIAKTTKSKDDKKEDNSKDDKKEDNSEVFNQLLMISKKSNEKEKDENTKKKNSAMLKLLTACSFDKDGNEIPLEERMDKMKDTMSSEQFEAFKKDMTDTYEKNKDNQDFKDALVKAKSNIKPEDYDKMIEDAKKEAKTTLDQLDKEKKEIEQHEEDIKKLEDQINGGDEKDKEIRELKKQLEELKKNPPQTIASSATGVNPGGGTPNNTDGDGEGRDTDTKPKEKTKEEIDAELKAVDDKYKKQEEDLEKEYDEKIKNEPDKDKKKQLEDEWTEKQKEIDKQKNKEKDAIDDNDAHDTEKDETKQGKYKVKDEEVTDPETGEKKKVKTYTGPRGGKFYYPDGKPKKPENKVYLESITLQDYLSESLI